jgi:DUF1680 family protein
MKNPREMQLYQAIAILLVVIAFPNRNTLALQQPPTTESTATPRWDEPSPTNLTLLPTGPIFDSLQVNRLVLENIGPKRALLAFRIQAKLPTENAKPLGGWAAPEPHGPFPGFFEAHYLSAISLQSLQQPDLLPQIHYIVDELAKCQQALGGKFLFASPESEFQANRLDGVAWYRMHKLLEALIAAHKFAKSEQALQVALNLTDWIEQRVQDYGDEFAKVKQVEYGGMTEALENLYELSGKKSLHQLALQWEEPERILKAFANGQDFNEHANTLLAKMVGAARIAEVSNSPFHQKATLNFWDNVCSPNGKTYATGGTSVHEGMPPIGRLANTSLRMPQETCVSYNLLKVTRSLYHLTGDMKYIDYYERSLFNAILGSQDPKTGWKTYYQPLGSNAIKDFRSNEVGCYCCNGTGMENPPRSTAMIYAIQKDQVRVQLFVPSQVHFDSLGLTLKQTSNFPYSPTGLLSIENVSDSSKTDQTTIALRIPAWCSSPSVKVNGNPIPEPLTPGSFTSLRRTWKQGDSIEYHFPYTLQFSPMPDDPNQVALVQGPLVLVGVGANDHQATLKLPFNPNDSQALQDWIQPINPIENATPTTTPTTTNRIDATNRLDARAQDAAGNTILFRPYFQIEADQFFTGYWNLLPNDSSSTPALNNLPLNKRPLKNLALGKPTTCSTPLPEGSNLECFMRSAKAVDGNYGGNDDWYVKWFPNGLSPQWIIVDLLKSQPIGSVLWIPAKEDLDAQIPYRYQIESSNDQQTWEPLADASENNTFQPAYEHPTKNRTARYIRLTTLPNPNYKEHQARPKIAELLVFPPQ